MEEYMTYCGLYCGACPSMIINEQLHNEPSVSQSPVPEGETACLGCNNDGLDSCEIVSCNKLHNTECCALCTEFPCPVIQNFNDTEWPHHADVIANLNRIKSIGIQAWLSEQAELWKCPKCNTRTHWYQTTCKNCGHNLSGMYQF